MLKKPRGTKEKVNERPIARSHLQSHEQTTAPSRAQAGGQPAAPSQRAAVGAGSRTHPPAGAAPAQRHGAPIAAFRAAPSPAGLQTRSPGPERHRLPLPLSSSPRQHCPPPLSPEAVTVSPLSGDAPRRLGPGSQHRQQHQHQGAAPRGARGRPQPGGGTCNTHTALGRVGVPLLPPRPLAVLPRSPGGMEGSRSRAGWMLCGCRGSSSRCQRSCARRPRGSCRHGARTAHPAAPGSPTGRATYPQRNEILKAARLPLQENTLRR